MTFLTTHAQDHSTSPDLVQARIKAGQLLDQVLDEVITPRQALNRWPTGIGIEDPSLTSAYQALWHFESDEDQQKTIVYYLDAQIELLKQMSRMLMQGKSLPLYMERPYPRSMRVRYYQSDFDYGAVWAKLKQFFESTGHLIGKSLQEIFARREI
jgi:hypothetical protein